MKSVLHVSLFIAPIVVGTSSATAAPKVIADIGPVAGLVQAVLGDSAEVTALVPANQSPHNAALRPSQARAAQEADLVIGIGPELTPGLWEKLDALAPNAQIISLLDVE